MNKKIVFTVFSFMLFSTSIHAQVIDESEIKRNIKNNQVSSYEKNVIAQSLLNQYHKYEAKQKNYYHPSLLTYEKGFLAQGEKNIDYFLEISKDNKIIYDGSFDILNSNELVVITGMYQGDKDDSEVIKKNIEVDGEGQKATESKSLKSFEVSLMVHMKENNGNLYSQFFVAQQDKNFSKEVVVAKSGSKVMGTQTSKGPETVKDKDEFIVQHKNNLKTTVSWRDYTFKILAKN